MTRNGFFEIARKNITHVGALMPSSRFAAKSITREIPPSRYVVEYGAGNGVITRQVVKILPPDGALVAIEMLEDFIPQLSQIKDERLHIMHADVIHAIRTDATFNLPHIDAVLSGIPFSFFPSAIREEIVQRTYECLAPGGRFLLYQTSPLMKPYLKKYFSRISMRLIARNLPPYFIMIAKK